MKALAITLICLVALSSAASMIDYPVNCSLNGVVFNVTVNNSYCIDDLGTCMDLTQD